MILMCLMNSIKEKEEEEVEGAEGKKEKVMIALDAKGQETLLDMLNGGNIELERVKNESDYYNSANKLNYFSMASEALSMLITIILFILMLREME